VTNVAPPREQLAELLAERVVELGRSHGRRDSRH